MIGPLESLMEIKARKVLDETSLHNTAHLRHETKTFIIHIQPKGILTRPILTRMIQTVQDRTNIEGLAMHTRELFTILGKVTQEDGTSLDNKIDKARVWDELFNVGMGKNVVFHTLRDSLDPRIFRPFLTEEALFDPYWYVPCKSCETKVIVHDGDDTAAVEEGVDLLYRLLAVQSPIRNRMDLHVWVRVDRADKTTRHD